MCTSFLTSFSLYTHRCCCCCWCWCGGGGGGSSPLSHALIIKGGSSAHIFKFRFKRLGAQNTHVLDLLLGLQIGPKLGDCFLKHVRLYTLLPSLTLLIYAFVRVWVQEVWGPKAPFMKFALGLEIGPKLEDRFLKHLYCYHR